MGNYVSTSDKYPVCSHPNVSLALSILGPFEFDQDHPEDLNTPYSRPYKFLGLDEIYIGQWKNNKMHGKGEYYGKNGRMCVGYFRDNKFHGKGRVIYEKGDVYEGGIVNAQREGEGAYFYFWRVDLVNRMTPRVYIYLDSVLTTLK